MRPGSTRRDAAAAAGGTSRSRRSPRRPSGRRRRRSIRATRTGRAPPAASAIAAGSFRLISSSTHSRARNCGIASRRSSRLMKARLVRPRRGAHARGDERQHRPQPDLALGSRGSCGRSRTAPVHRPKRDGGATTVGRSDRPSSNRPGSPTGCRGRRRVRRRRPRSQRAGSAACGCRDRAHGGRWR